MPAPASNGLFEQLVKNEHDAIGAFAYVLYKQEKVAFIEAIQTTHGRPPTEAEMLAFHLQASTPQRIAAYRQSAELLAQAFLNAGLKIELDRYAEDIQKSVWSQKLDLITQEIRARKSFSGWLRDVGGNLLVNFATILLLGFLLGGYQILSKFNSSVEKLARLPEVPAAQTRPVNVPQPTRTP